MPHDGSTFYQENPTDDKDAIQHLKQGIIDGKPWHIAVFEAIALWIHPEEDYNKRHYRYLIDCEAFDWLLLAERLCTEISQAIPEKELIDFLFFGKLPQPFSEEEFREIIGEAKYHAYLNYLYGVTVEDFVILAIEEEIHKEHYAHALTNDKEVPADSYQRLYGATHEELLHTFREKRGYQQSDKITLDEMHVFTYWLFKYRLKNSDRARLASDTKKGIDYMRQQRLAKGYTIDENSQPYVIDLNDSR